ISPPLDDRLHQERGLRQPPCSRYRTRGDEQLGHSSLTVVSPTSITAQMPSSPWGPCDIRVRTVSGISAMSSADQFFCQEAPTVSAVSPASGPTAGGTVAQATGTQFIGASGVKVGKTAATGMRVNSPTSITTTSPAEELGTVDVQVTTPSGTGPTISGD